MNIQQYPNKWNRPLSNNSNSNLSEKYPTIKALRKAENKNIYGIEIKQGIKIIKKRSNLGLKTLYDLCKIDTQPTTFDLGFKLGPRINAGGRVGKSSHGAELLISSDPQKAYKIAT